MELHVVPQLRRGLAPAKGPDPLRDRLGQHVEAAVLDLLDPDRVEALAEDMRVIERRRVHHVGLVVASLVLSAFECSGDTEGRLLDAAMTYRQLGGPASSEKSFRLMARKVVPVLETLLKRQMARLESLASTPELRGRLRAFRDVLIPDGCAFKIANALAGTYAGTSQPAEFKLCAVYSVRAGGAVAVEKAAGRVHDNDLFKPESWKALALYIWDLGFNDYGRFIDGALANAYLLQRLKDDANPLLLASYGPTGARRDVLDVHGKPLRLNDAIALGLVHRNRELDLDVQLRDDKGRTLVARVVCVRVDGQDRYYLTNLPREIFTPCDVAELYRVRWEVELFFRQWKGSVRLDHVRYLRHVDSLKAAVTASLLAAALAREVATGLDELAQDIAAEQAAFSP